jgi:hypothetical protein
VSAMQAAGCTLAVAVILLASTCTAYSSMVPESTLIEIADTLSAEVSCYIKQCPLQLLYTCLRGAARQKQDAS